jgi:TolB protein
MAFTLAVVPTLILSSDKATAGSFPGINGKIVFESNRDGDYDIYVMDSDGGNVTQLTDTAGDDVRPRWSADGTKIVYQANGDGDEEVRIMDHDGSNNIQLTSDDHDQRFPSFAPNGETIVYSQNEGGSDTDIWTMDVDGSNNSKIADRSSHGYRPQFSPDGNTIIFEESVGGEGFNIFKMNADGTNVTDIGDADNHDLGGIWLPDGSKILYAANSDGYQIFTMDPDGTNRAEILSHSDSESEPSASPDGEQLVYNRYNSDADIYKANIDGSGATNLTSSATDQDRNPDWQPLTIEPTANNEDLVLEVGDDGTATLNAEDIFSDAYGAGISTVTIISQPESGSVEVDGTTITYTQDNVASASNNFWNNISSFFFPTVSAQSPDDSFDLQVCSGANTALCTEATISVTLAAVASTTNASGVLADTGHSAMLIAILGVSLLICGGLVLSRSKSKKAD